MRKQPFDLKKYLKIQRENILKRISSFGDKLYLEFGGKLFDDYHASRVLPGFAPDAKLQMLLGIKDKAEILIVVNANDINSNKIRGDIGITYQEDVLRLIDAYKDAVENATTETFSGTLLKDHKTSVSALKQLTDLWKTAH